LIFLPFVKNIAEFFFCTSVGLRVQNSIVDDQEEELRGCYVLGADNPRFENGDTLLVTDRPWN